MKDSDYSTPQDHYFSYLNRKKQHSRTQVEMENDVLLGLDLDQSIALYDLHMIFNQAIDENSNALEEIDIIQLSKETGLGVKHILHVIEDLKEKKKWEFGNKRSKKDN